MGKTVANTIVQGHLNSIQATIKTLEAQVTTYEKALIDTKAKLADLLVAEGITLAGMRSKGVAVPSEERSTEGEGEGKEEKK